MVRDAQMQAMLEACQTIAIVGANDKPGQPVDRVGRYLMDQGYGIIPIHPKRKTVWGMDALPSLADLEWPVDIVNLFRAPGYCPDHAREVLAMQTAPKLFWMQSGIESPEAAELLAGTSIEVVQDRCLMVEHRRLCS